MNKLLIVCGPTATGKTKLAINLAKKFNGELISADSRQVYKGMDIGTGKDLEINSKPKTQNSKLRINNKYTVGFYKINEIPVWLLDIVDPDKKFSVAEYQKLARKVIEDIIKREKIPVLVGGTGLYIKAVVDGIETIGIPQDWKLRKKLEKLQVSDLQKELQKIDFQRFNLMNNSDKNNPRRLTRAIEIAEYKSKNPCCNDLNNYNKKSTNILIIGLTAGNKILYKRIDKRVDERIKEGIIEEIRNLLQKGYSWDLPSMSGLGYRVWKDYFAKKITQEEVIKKWKNDEHNYAKRQLTWFKKDKRINWFNINDKNYLKNVCKNVIEWLSIVK